LTRQTGQTYNFVTVDVTDSIATVTIDKPPANAFNPSMIAELLEILPVLASDQTVRVIVVTGTGRFFVAGADITVMRELRFELAAEYLVMAAILAEVKSRMLLPRPPSVEGEEADPRAELVRRLQEYERFKQAAEDIDALPRQDRDTTVAHAFMPERAAVKLPPPVDLKEMLMALHDVLKRAELFTGHAIKREALSVRQRMGEVLGRLEDGRFYRFENLFTAEEGKLGVLVTFLAVLELAKEQLLDLVQEEPLAPIYVKSLAAGNTNAPLQFSSEFDDNDAANENE